MAFDSKVMFDISMVSNYTLKIQGTKFHSVCVIGLIVFTE